MEEELIILEEMAKAKHILGERAKQYLSDSELARQFLNECALQFKSEPIKFKEHFGAKAYVKFQNYRLNNNL